MGNQEGLILQGCGVDPQEWLDAPSAASSTYNIWYMSGSTYQTCINLYSASSGNLNAYFKLKAPALGAISLTKTTEDGKNLSGWRFGIYSDSACTSLVSGPHTTDSSGKISVTGLSASTYYVKELGHTDSSICSTTETSCGSRRTRTRACAPWNRNCAAHTTQSGRFWMLRRKPGYPGHFRKRYPTRCSWNCCSRRSIRRRHSMFCRTILTSTQNWPERA